MVVGREATDSENVEEFPYLGSVIASSRTVNADVETRIAKASCAFGALRKPVFMDKNLRLDKRRVYDACVLAVLLCGSECWTPLRRHARKLNSFHRRCIRTILGISNLEQWAKRIACTEIMRQCGDFETASDKITKCRVQWLGHLARMQDTRIPKATFFGWLCQPHPRSGPKRRWKGVIWRDLKNINLDEGV